ncbi:hypothetical protein MMMIC1C10_18270 [Methanococcus maripaludis]|jgi:hypothetical protein|uniref:CARDB domain-containing protein n=2 Tax=Methanococcus maripaludis TaxID=39152 RepID=A0A2Z5PJC1_METMI|nr:hypothetical protein MMKA1_12270 [Methanococcus maripaludis KA1]BAP63243.1 hypothetical protein MMOS7_11570 [Methanococcus maripaludis OS7]
MIHLRSATLLCSIGLVSLVVISILGITHLNTNSTLSNDQNDVRTALQNGNPSSGNLKILNHQMTKSIFGNWIVKGQVENTGSSELRYATIEVNFYKNGNLLYTNPVNLNSIAPGETKDFEVIYKGSDSSPDSYSVVLGPYL